MSLKYRVLTFDLDGTLTNSEKKITPLTKDAIREAQKEGAVIVLASGRPVYGIMPIAKELNLDKEGGYILAYNGGCIIDCKTMKTVYEKKIPDNLVPEICRYAQKHNLSVLTYEGDTIITSFDNEYVQEEARINKLPVRQISNLGEYINFPVNKFLITESPETVLKYIDDVRNNFPRLNIFRSAPFFMEIVPPDINKALTLEKLLNMLSLERNNLAAFGDGDNDAEMIEYAGLGIAMENAGEKCRECADYITRSNDDEGIAHAIRRFVL